MRRKVLVLTFISFAGWGQPAKQQAQPLIVVKVVEMPRSPDRDAFGYLQALGPLIATLVAVCVGLMQRHLQQQNLDQNLFDKRFAVYDAITSYLVENMGEHPTWVRHLLKFPMRRQAGFLFGADMCAFCDELDAMIRRWDLAFGQCCEIGSESGERKLKERTIGTEALFRELRYAREPLGEPMLDKLEQICRPYLQLHDERNWFLRLLADFDHWMDTADKTLASRYK